MISALLYKEWIKLRLWWLLALVACLGFAVILVLRLQHAIEMNGAAMVWSAWLTRGYLFFRPFQHVPLVLGAVAALLQFLPEIQNHRIRLVLHLPLGENRAVGVHLAAGLLFVASCCLASLTVFSWAAYAWFPEEYQGVLLRTFTPWLLAGAGAYLLGAAALLETQLWNRCLLLLIAVGALRLGLRESFFDSYRPLLPWLSLWTVLLVSLPLYASLRFRKGLGR